MNEVSTRPHKSATPPAKAVTAVTKPFAPLAAAAVKNEEYNRSSLRSAFATLADLLRQAAHTDEPHELSGDSDRLLNVAADLASTASNNVPDAEEAERLGFDIAALVIASRSVLGDTSSDARRAFITQAKPLLSWITEADDVLQETDADKRMRIAFDANYSIQELAKALKTHHLRESADDWPVYCGILGQIQQLSEVVFCAMRLGGTEESMTYPSLETLQHFLDGHFTLIVRDER